MILEEHLETTVKVHDQQLHRRVDLLLRTGKLLVESLADTNRIVKNMKRTGNVMLCDTIKRILSIFV